MDVAQDVIVMGQDCGTLAGVPVTTGTLDEVLGPVGERCFGRFPRIRSCIRRPEKSSFRPTR